MESDYFMIQIDKLLIIEINKKITIFSNIKQ